MGDDVVGRLPCYLVPLNGDGSKATIASSTVGMWLLVLISGKVPFQHIPAPVTGRANDQVLDMPCQLLREIARGSYPLFGEVNMLVGMGIMNFRKRLDHSPIQVKCRTIHIFRSLRIVQDSDGIIRPVGIVVVQDNLGIYII